jgi:COMPASS component SWD3
MGKFELKHRLKGHEGTISNIKYSPNGLYIGSCSVDQRIHIYSAENGKLLLQLKGHQGGISDISWSADSNLLCSASDDGTIKLWKLNLPGNKENHNRNACSYNLVHTMEGHTNFVVCCCFSPESSVIASGSFDETLRIWSTQTGECIKILSAHTDPISSVDFSRDGTILVSSGFDGICRLWDTHTGECLKTLITDTNHQVTFCKFSPNSKFVLAGSLDGCFRLWQYTKAKCLKTYKGGHENNKMCLSGDFCVTGSEKLILTGSEDGHVYMYDLQTKDVMHKILVNKNKKIIHAVAANPLETEIAVGGTDKVISIYKQS